MQTHSRTLCKLYLCLTPLHKDLTQKSTTKTTTEVIVAALLYHFFTCVTSTTFQDPYFRLNHPLFSLSHTALSISLKPTWPVSTGGGSWQTHEAKYAGLYAGWRVVLHSTLKMSQPAYQPRRAKIRHSRNECIAQLVGFQTGHL